MFVASKTAVHISIHLMYIISISYSSFFLQLSRPKHRRHTLVFSRHACIMQEEGHLTLQIRVGDMRRSHLIESRVHGVLVKRHVVREKYVYPLFQHQVSWGSKHRHYPPIEGSGLEITWDASANQNVTVNIRREKPKELPLCLPHKQLHSNGAKDWLILHKTFKASNIAHTGWSSG